MATRSASLGPTMMVTRCFQSGSTGAPEIARGSVFLGSSPACASRTPDAPAPSPPTARKHCRRRDRLGLGGNVGCMGRLLTCEAHLDRVPVTSRFSRCKHDVRGPPVERHVRRIACARGFVTRRVYRFAAADRPSSRRAVRASSDPPGRTRGRRPAPRAIPRRSPAGPHPFFGLEGSLTTQTSEG